MKKLLNSIRLEGYPITGEILDALNETQKLTARAFHGLTRGRNIPPRSFMWSFGTIRPTNILTIEESGEFVKLCQCDVDASISIHSPDNPSYSHLCANPRKYTLIDTSEYIDIRKPDGSEVFEKAILVEKYTITLADTDPNNGHYNPWTFIPTDQLYGNQPLANIRISKIGLPNNGFNIGNNSYIKVDPVRQQVFLYLEVFKTSTTPNPYEQLALSLDLSGYIKIDNGRYYSLSAIYYDDFTKLSLPVGCYYNGGKIVVSYPKNIYDLGQEMVGVFINGAIQL